MGRRNRDADLLRERTWFGRVLRFLERLTPGAPSVNRGGGPPPSLPRDDGRDDPWR